MFLSTAINDYIGSLVYKSASTRSTYLILLKRFWEKIGEVQINEITRKMVKEYFRDYTNKFREQVKVNTHTTALAAVRGMFKWLVEEDYLEINPCKDIPARQYRKDLGEIPVHLIDRSLTEAQIKTIFYRISSYPSEYALILGLMYKTGIRVDEALNIEISQIRNDCIFLKSTKGNKPRFAPIDREVKISIDEHLLQKGSKEQKYLFESPLKKGQPLCYSGVRMVWKGITCDLRNGDNSSLTIHQLRHTFATERASKIDSYSLRDLMGHTDVKTSNRYVSHSPDRVNRAARATRNAGVKINLVETIRRGLAS